MEILSRQFRGYFADAAAQVRNAWGEPTYLGSCEDAEFPDWCPGLEPIYWERGDRIAYLWWEHQDQELTFFVVAGANTKSEHTD